MDIHRCRFVPYPASAINAVAFTHVSLPSLSAAKKSAQKNVQVRLAIGRANGDIEIWNPLNGVWHQELIIPGGRARSVDGLVWVTDPDEEMADGKTIHGRSRLFSIGYTTTITEWDLEKARAKTHASGQHGDIWCLGVQPLPAADNGHVNASASRKLVAGTVDGNLVLYSIEDGELRFEKTLIRTPSKKTKMVSLAFQSRNVVIVGCSDSTICAYDIRNGTLLGKMTLGSDFSGGSKNIIVWSVKCLPNGDIVSGDSTGQVCIWDGKTYTQAQRIQSHTQDILCLAVSADGSKIVSGGMDRRTSLYEPVAGQAGRWSKVFHRRYHSHDVKAMASFEGKGMSVVVSGGPDASPVVFPLRGAGKEFHRTLPHLPQNTNLQSAPKARFVVSWWGGEIRIWHLLSPARELFDDADDSADLRKNRKLLAKIMIKGESNITSAAISEDGTLLVVSTASDIKAFQLELTNDSFTQQLKVKKVDMVATTSGATKVEISPDNLWVSWIEEGSKVMIARVAATASETGIAYTISNPSKLHRLRRQISKHILLGGLGSYDRNITQVTFSPDSKMIGVADLAGYIDTWVLRGPKDLTNGTSGEVDDDLSGGSSNDDSSDDESEQEPTEGGERWIRNPKAALIPRLASAPVVLSFAKCSAPATPSPLADNGDYTLLAITTLKQVLVFNPLQGALSDWSRRNTYAKLPEQLRVTRDLVKGVVWQGPRAWIYGVSFLFMLDLSQDLSSEADSLTELKNGHKQQHGIKRKRDLKHESGAGGKMDKHTLAPQQIKTAIQGPEGAEWVDVEMADADDAKSIAGASSGVEDDDDEDDDETDGGELQRMRDGTGANGDGALIGGEKGGKLLKQKARWWHTYQYRPILGIVPVQGEQDEAAAGEVTSSSLPPLEVALIERPTWEVDLNPRYFGNGEWER
ncbi:quinon protein alcohol dehydrogenase-like superfamily [Podospora appendiculata]|uniref:Quinon protein alcohol dehydrogenase-like superfamily n=1 Tax=Podospora appendiculata TaxID=314037 RepID=A0AAE0XKC2_9PEZI|nr:quinon protein alcohol dehydrogenase-like superfamily [Podospora appendiculata]